MLKLCFILVFGYLLMISANDEFHDEFSSTTRLFSDIGRETPEIERTDKFWIESAQSYLTKSMKSHPTKRRAKNAILFIGDGMSIPTLTGTRIYKGQQKGSKTGEEEILEIEDFNTGVLKTYCTNGQVPDSACATTALLSGIKTNVLCLGVTARVKFNDCSSSNDKANQVESIFDWAQKVDKSTGIVTTTSITDATPAAAYAHAANRFWETDTDVRNFNQNPDTCQDIAYQLIHNNPGKNFNVILGGGRSKFLPTNIPDDQGINGQRIQGNLIEKWKEFHPNGKYCWNRNQLESLDIKATTNVLGLFAPGHMSYSSEANRAIEPTLAEMTAKAIELLNKNKKGFLLLVEGGRIDHGHHETRARKAFDETLELEKAIKKALEMTNEKETLIVVTADHGQTMSLGGYPRRGNNILGIDELNFGSDGQKSTVINYANGPENYIDNTGKRVDITNSISPDFQYPSYIPRNTATHGGEDVLVSAHGVCKEMIYGFAEQNFISHYIAFCLCIGNKKTFCRKNG